MSDEQGPPQIDHAAPFQVMAQKIRHNADSKFGGAMVVVPPDGTAGNIELLMLDAYASPAQFWSTAKTRIEMILAELEEQQRNLQGFRR